MKDGDRAPQVLYDTQGTRPVSTVRSRMVDCSTGTRSGVWRGAVQAGEQRPLDLIRTDTYGSCRGTEARAVEGDASVGDCLVAPGSCGSSDLDLPFSSFALPPPPQATRVGPGAGRGGPEGTAPAASACYADATVLSSYDPATLRKNSTARWAYLPNSTRQAGSSPHTCGVRGQSVSTE